VEYSASSEPPPSTQRETDMWGMSPYEMLGRMFVWKYGRPLLILGCWIVLISIFCC